MSGWKKHYTSPHFLICIGVLAVSCVGMNMIMESLGMVSRKEPIPLVKPFDGIDEYKLWPYKVITKTKIDNYDILESLGTEDYIQWILEDTTAEQTSSSRYVSLFLTYYTGINDRIPHVPEECYFGAGSQRDDLRNERIALECPELRPSGEKLELPVRVLTFSRTSADILSGTETFNVSYFFKVNSSYANGRTEARNILGTNILGKYSFFSKVEWRFFGVSGNAQYEETIEASKPMLEKLLPVLEREHWPNLEKLNKESEDQQAK
ncbi:hypothetical protein SMSP2_02295 [Limihaloglobus sulfuriphilus]|uniref:Methanolan biosynthesis EpsI domain-containing protein n=1 Tax=Limihaloglobus sulfuriphilus TaxID=1851148 RepID=A0A1R7T5X0_9BACT|nr:hypothetical protein [Limihaloglobus sulfuriphilus]AQQ71916.1 hypothetical protein SMSP2_02295 [Limihaloglobus sulfuriphilus]